MLAAVQILEVERDVVRKHCAAESEQGRPGGELDGLRARRGGQAADVPDERAGSIAVQRDSVRLWNRSEIEGLAVIDAGGQRVRDDDVLRSAASRVFVGDGVSNCFARVDRGGSRLSNSIRFSTGSGKKSV